MHRPVHVADSAVTADPFRYSTRTRMRVVTTGTMAIEGNLLQPGENEIVVPDDVALALLDRVADPAEVKAAEAHAARLVSSWDGGAKLPPYSMPGSFQVLFGREFSGILEAEVIESGIQPRLTPEEQREAAFQAVLAAQRRSQKSAARKTQSE